MTIIEKLIAQINFLRNFKNFKKLSLSDSRFKVSWRSIYPIVDEATTETGYDRHYLLHSAWAARILAKIKPPVHVDLSSSMTFSTQISAFIPIKYYEFRPPKLQLGGFEIGKANLTNLPFSSGSINSLSCMHVIEHVGLGRYGDEIDPQGDLKAISEMQRVLAPGGNLLFVVPIGKPLLEFNAHRIYSFRQIIDAFASLSLAEFTLIPDSAADGNLVENASEELANAQKNGCGCFLFSKQ